MDEIKGILSELLSVFFPVRCVHCGRGGAWLCPECAAQLKQVGPGGCRRCGRPARRDVPVCSECRGRELLFASARAAFIFEGPARSLVHRLKYSGQRRLAATMADLTVRQGNLTDVAKDATLTYVPLHRSRLLNRGYNQAGMYAKALAQRLDLPLQELLCKQNPTSPQNRLNLEQRQVNLGGSIMLKKGAGCGSGKVMLVDDVYTTGSTVSECARVLKNGLGAEVHVWTFARTVRARRV